MQEMWKIVFENVLISEYTDFKKIKCYWSTPSFKFFSQFIFVVYLQSVLLQEMDVLKNKPIGSHTLLASFIPERSEREVQRTLV